LYEKGEKKSVFFAGYGIEEQEVVGILRIVKKKVGLNCEYKHK
jgi:hypothetical protein